MRSQEVVVVIEELGAKELQELIVNRMRSPQSLDGVQGRQVLEIEMRRV